MRRIRFAALWLTGVSICALALFVVWGTPLLAQSPLPTFVLDAQTTISVTVTLADGQVVVVPIDLTFVTRSELEGAYVTLDATAQQPTNATVTVQESGHISAAMKALVYRATSTPVTVVQPTAIPPTNTPLPPTVAPTLAAVVPTNTPVPQATPAPATGATYGIGDDVFTGNIKWRVIESEDLGNRMVSDNEFIDDATTNGRFVRVRVEVDNRGSDPYSYWTPEMLDSQERSFNDFSGGYSFIPDEQECIFLVVNPGLSQQCVHIYEVAGDAQGLKIKVTDSVFFGNEAVIELR